ncbi:MAG: 2-C-methyl-D-erythritol 2,4-cyclodiphosphate synthase [Eubacteriales bacterium]|nr:2-C-methyl-D-erythritol 2,4-cyclodiphosphate synthase [Eubacteriales bacterium]
MAFEYRSTIGQDSHRFVDRLNRPATAEELARPLLLGGFEIPSAVGLSGNSDADVILHALTNAVSGLTGINILGKISDQMCLEEGITDSRAYLKRALQDMGDWQITHVSVTIEGKRPHLSAWIDPMRKSIAQIIGIEPRDVGITATTGEGLTDFGRGDGLQVFCILTARRPDNE